MHYGKCVHCVHVCVCLRIGVCVIHDMIRANRCVRYDVTEILEHKHSSHFIKGQDVSIRGSSSAVGLNLHPVCMWMCSTRTTIYNSTTTLLRSYVLVL